MRRSLMLVAAVALAALVFAPAAIAQDHNPTGDDLRGDDRGGQRGFDDNPSTSDLRGGDRGGVRGFDDKPTADDVMSSSTATASPTASAPSTSSATSTATASATALPDTGGAPVGSLLGVAAGVLLVGGGIVAAKLMRRTP